MGGYSPWGRKESDMTEQLTLGVSQVALVKNLPANAGDVRDAGLIPGQEDPLEKRMATYSSILACRTPWTEEPGRLQYIGSHRVEHD